MLADRSLPSRCSRLALLFVFLTVPGRVKSVGAAEPPLHPITSMPSSGLYTDGERMKVQVEAPTDGSRLIAEDAQGVTVFQKTLRAGHQEVTLETAHRRYLRLRLEDAQHPAQAPGWISVGVLPRKVGQDRRFGFNATPEQSPVVRQLGGTWVRCHMPWEQGGEQQPLGSAALDKTIGLIHAGGCEVFGISSYSLPWASVVGPDDTRPMREYFSPPRPQPWEAYLRFTAQQIRGQVPLFEVWNEPNLDLFWRSTPNTFEQRVTDYAGLLKRSYPILKAENPGLQVTTGSICNQRNSLAQKFFQELLDAGCGSCFDVVNLHYYSSSRPPEDGLPQYLGDFRDLVAKTGKPRPLWLTEIGWTTEDNQYFKPISEWDQAAFLVRAHVLAFAAGVETVIWFQLESADLGVMVAGRGPKPAAVAYAQMVGALRDRKLKDSLVEGTVHIARFHGDRDDVMVVWSTDPSEWRLPRGFSLKRAENVLGEQVNLPTRKRISLTSAPVYLFGR